MKIKYIAKAAIACCAPSFINGAYGAVDPVFFASLEAACQRKASSMAPSGVLRSPSSKIFTGVSINAMTYANGLTPRNLTLLLAYFAALLIALVSRVPSC